MTTKVKFIILIIQCLIKRVISGPARDLVLNPKTILIVQLAWLGDMVCTTPMFSAIKKKYPQCRVIVIGMSRNEKLLEHHPYVDRYIVWRESFNYIKKELKSEMLDFACITSPNFLSLAYLYLLNVDCIAVPEIRNGYSPLETKTFKFIRAFIAVKVPHTMGTYAPREYLRLLEPAGIFSDDTKKYLTYSSEAEVKVKQFLKSHINGSNFRVAISPSVGNKIKNWDPVRFSQVADCLIDTYHAQVYVIGSPLDEMEVTKMISAAKYKDKIINTLNMFNIDELKAFMKEMDLFLSVDTGPMYIAEAFGVPTINIIGPMDEREQPPQGEMHISLISPTRTTPLIHVMNSRTYDPVLFRESLDGITVEMVCAGIAELHQKIYVDKRVSI